VQAGILLHRIICLCEKKEQNGNILTKNISKHIQLSFIILKTHIRQVTQRHMSTTLAILKMSQLGLTFNKKCIFVCNHFSISPTFYEQHLRQYPFAKRLQSQTVRTEKMGETLLYSKAGHKMLMKLRPRVKFHQRFTRAFFVRKPFF